MADLEGQGPGELVANAVDAHRRGQIEAAAAQYAKILEAWPTEVNALNNLAIIKKHQGDFQGALALLSQAFDAHSGNAVVAAAYGNLCFGLKDLSEARRAYARTLDLTPSDPAVLRSQADVLRQLGLTSESIAHYDRLLSLEPGFAEGWAIRGGLKADLSQPADAAVDFARALELKPEFPQAWNNYSQVLRLLGRLNDALVATENALRNQPDYPLAQVNRAKALSDLSRPGESAKAWAIALKGRPHHLNGLGLMLQEKAKACDWSGYQEIVAEIRQKTREGQTVDLPWTFLSHTADPHLQLQSAKIHLGDRFPAAFDPLWRGEVYDHDRIRLAYVSSDFRNHAMSHLISGLFKRHDRTRFEVTGLALGPASNDAVRQKLIPTFDRFFDLKDLSDVAAAQLIRQLEIDILIDLNGFTTYCRPGIFAHRPAPLQINYLGHPATMGAPFMDYIIGDRWVTPKTLEEAYSEAIIRMPHAYQVNNVEREISEVTPTRKQVGLPDEGFVFCCFNANFKITPDVFAIWMRLLKAVPGSVLWLMQNHPEAAANLRLSAQAAGLDPARLVFAPALPVNEHLARHRLADLFLDTFNYNAHTTASDALWAGLPIVTFAGDGFASRVAASLLDAVGLSALITESPAEYEALALSLAQDSERLATLKSHLKEGRMAFPLFDTDRVCQGLETAFEAIHERQHQGLVPIGLDVADLMGLTG